MNILHKLSVAYSLQTSKRMMLVGRSISLICICLSALAVSASAQSFTYYVDSVSGNDSNPGSQGAPWKIGRAHVFVLSGIISLICICLSALAVSASAQSFTYYVDSVSGNDSNPGSQGAPWKTIAKVKSTKTN